MGLDSIASTDNTPSIHHAATLGKQSEESVYFKYPFLLEYRDYLGDIGIEQILWEWNFGVIVRWQTNEKVYKIWKNPEFSAMLQDEYERHIAFYSQLMLLKEDERTRIAENIRIPEVAVEPLVLENWLVLYEMELVNWMSLNRLDLMTEFWDLLVWEDTDRLTDWDLTQLLQNQYNISEEEIILLSARWKDVLIDHFPQAWREVSRLLELLRSAWYEHEDLHSWNILISGEPDNPIIYLIDFWKSRIPTTH